MQRSEDVNATASEPTDSGNSLTTVAPSRMKPQEDSQQPEPVLTQVRNERAHDFIKDTKELSGPFCFMLSKFHDPEDLPEPAKAAYKAWIKSGAGEKDVFKCINFSSPEDEADKLADRIPAHCEVTPVCSVTIQSGPDHRKTITYSWTGARLMGDSHCTWHRGNSDDSDLDLFLTLEAKEEVADRHDLIKQDSAANEDVEAYEFRTSALTQPHPQGLGTRNLAGSGAEVLSSAYEKLVPRGR